MKKICVFCSSSKVPNPNYINVARELGELLGKGNYHLIYGGSHRGLMGELSKTFKEHNDNITEIIPKMWESITVEKESAIITEEIYERLREMHINSDAFIVIPGGFGSLHELLDVLVTKQLGIHNKPIVIINTNNLYDSFIKLIDNVVSEGFAPEDHKLLFIVVKTPTEALDFIENYSPAEPSQKLG